MEARQSWDVPSPTEPMVLKPHDDDDNLRSDSDSDDENSIDSQ